MSNENRSWIPVPREPFKTDRGLGREDRDSQAVSEDEWKGIEDFVRHMARDAWGFIDPEKGNEATFRNGIPFEEALEIEINTFYYEASESFLLNQELYWN